MAFKELLRREAWEERSSELLEVGIGVGAKSVAMYARSPREVA